MAVIDLNNLVRPKQRNNPNSLVSSVIVKPDPVYVDLHLDLKGADNIGLGTNAVRSGDILVDYDLDAVKNSLRNIFTTKKGQKILNPTFGSALEQYLFTQITDANAKAIGTEILNDIQKHEPRIKISNILVNPRFEENLYYISIYYSLIDIKKENIIDIIAKLGGQIFL
jgi:phage baseplate assembly protein W